MAIISLLQPRCTSEVTTPDRISSSCADLSALSWTNGAEARAGPTYSRLLFEPLRCCVADGDALQQQTHSDLGKGMRAMNDFEMVAALSERHLAARSMQIDKAYLPKCGTSAVKLLHEDYLTSAGTFSKSPVTVRAGALVLSFRCSSCRAIARSRLALLCNCSRQITAQPLLSGVLTVPGSCRQVQLLPQVRQSVLAQA